MDRLVSSLRPTALLCSVSQGHHHPPGPPLGPQGDRNMDPKRLSSSSQQQVRLRKQRKQRHALIGLHSVVTSGTAPAVPFKNRLFSALARALIAHAQ
ncbi:hypothetical protein INR49_009005 [Caranx melampygus]|nr:hypothetical protein INR49_009005 [Caranx melampygus]